MKIVTKIQSLDGKRSKVFLEEEFAFVLYKGELRQYKIQEQQPLPEKDYEERIKEVLPKRAKKRALYLLQKRSYTEKKLREKLREGHYPAEIVEQTIEYVKSYHYIDDYSYALEYISYRKEKVSRRILEEKLKEKGIQAQILQQAMEEVYSSKKEEEELQFQQAIKLLKKRSYNGKSADIKEAAKNNLWGKTINAGQTCIAPDYVLVDEQVKEEFINEIKQELEENYKAIENCEDYPKIINLHHYIRLCNMIDREKNVIGGSRREDGLKIAPAVIENASFQSETMKDEIFGPILPVISYYRLDAMLEELKKKPKPLACYIYSKDKNMINTVNREISYGGGCINDCLLHIANGNLPFGGVGNSGIGAYHGYYSYKTFSHEKAVLINTGLFKNSFKERPYTGEKLKKLRKWLRD